MNIFVDTSGFLAILDADDTNHLNAKKEWRKIVSTAANLFCNNYILVETFALIQHRLGMKAVKVLEEDILPLVHIEWIKESTHKAGMSAFLSCLIKRQEWGWMSRGIYFYEVNRRMIDF